MISFKEVAKDTVIDFEESDIRNFFRQHKDQDSIFQAVSHDYTRLYGEIDIEEVTRETAFGVKPFYTVYQIKSILDIIDFYEREEKLDLNFFAIEVAYKDGKFIPSSSSVDRSNKTLPVLKFIKEKYPQLNIPPIISQIKLYPFKDTDICPKDDLYFHDFVNCKSYLWLDKDKNISSHYTGYAEDIHGIPKRLKIVIKSKSEIKELQRKIDIMFDTSRLYESKRVKIVAIDNGQLGFCLDDKLLSDKEIYSLEQENLKKLREKYEQVCKRIEYAYKKFRTTYDEYLETKNMIEVYQKHIEKFTKSSAISRLLNHRKGIYISSKIQNPPLDIDFNDLETIKSNILDPDRPIRFKSSIEGENFNEIYKKIRALENVEQYILRYTEEVEKKLKNLKDVFSKLEDIKEKIYNSPSKKEYDIPSADFTLGEPTIEVIKRVTKDDKVKQLYQDIQIEQSTILSSEEKMALMIYKTLFYLPMNKIIGIKRSKGEISQEELQAIVEWTHNYIMERIDSPRNPHKRSNTKFIIDDLLPSNKNSYTKEKIEKLILHYLPLVESALQKFSTKEEMIVYRVVYTNEPSKLGNNFLSTTTDPSIALGFLQDYERQNIGGSPVIYKIHIPAGSNAIFFTSELFTGKINDAYPFQDEQQEVLIDSQNFNFEIEAIDTIYDAGKTSEQSIDQVLFMDIKAIPKRIMGHSEQQKTTKL